MKKKVISVKRAFTLAEVLITLTIIGIVAVMVIPPLITKWKEEAYAKGKAIFSQKLTEATKQMNINSDLSPYSDTVSFTKKFKKYIKIIQVCNDDKISNCFVDKFYNDKGEEIEVSKLTDSKNLGKSYSTKNVSLRMLDGMSVILTYNPDCTPADPYQSNNYTTSCLSYILDVNGDQKPNTIGKDITMSGDIVLSVETCLTFGALCITPDLVEYTPTNAYCGDRDTTECLKGNNHYDGAKNACSALGMRLPTLKELQVLYPCAPGGTHLDQNRFKICNNPGNNPNKLPNVPVWSSDIDRGYGPLPIWPDGSTLYSSHHTSHYSIFCVK